MRSASKALVILTATAAAGLTLAGIGLDRSATASSQRAELSFATVDTIGLLEQMLQTPAYQGPRDSSRDTYEVQLKQLQTLNDATITILQNLAQNDPSYQMNVAQYQNQQAQMQNLGSQFAQEIDVMAAKQATEIYTMITAAVETVAAREGIDHVFSNRIAPDAELAIGLAGVTQQILARPLIRTSSVNLTVAVRDEMGLPDPAIAAAEAAAAAEEAAAAQAALLESLQNNLESGDAEQGDGQEPADESEGDDG